METTTSTDHAVVLANDRLLLRAFRSDDAQAICEAVRESMPELGIWLSWCHADYSIEDSRAFLAARCEAHSREQEHAFAICDRASGRFLGATGINQLDLTAKRANLGYWLRTSATGHGYATQATRLVAAWALGEFDLQLERIEIVAAVGNVASQRVAARAGATREGIARSRLRVHGVPHDAVVFSLIRRDFQK